MKLNPYFFLHPVLGDLGYHILKQQLKYKKHKNQPQTHTHPNGAQHVPFPAKNHRQGSDGDDYRPPLYRAPNRQWKV